MTKTPRELAFLRDLYITDDWTKRFTELADEHVKFKDAENLLYINAGTGTHCFEIRERIDDNTAVFALCEDEHLMAIAQDKAVAVSSDVDFSTMHFEDDAFDAVITDASLVPPSDIDETLRESSRVARIGADISVLTVTAGSFGEIFSLLWEVLLNDDLGEHGTVAEKMISDLPSVSRLEEIAAKAGYVNLHTHTSNEVFEYEDGAALISSPLIVDFFMPQWLKGLSEDEVDTILEKLGKLIDSEKGSLSFRFSVKATLLTGEKS
ncbi:MAG: class I SAM-dependent methyltransferase [Acidobacteria bacterium]|nr:class I SAM-dependent methyltransferase [Acidobacteriota bacterium]